MSVRTLFIVLLFVAAWNEAHCHCKGNAVYHISTACTWTAENFPTDFPKKNTFSPLCGNVHNCEYSMFQIGALATDGVKEMAELGACDLLQGEIDECVADGNCAAGQFFAWPCDSSGNAPGVPGGVCTLAGNVTLTPDHSFVSMTTMLAPSPDWFVGVSGVNLCVKNKASGQFEWLDQYPPKSARELLVYDSGTDSGASFESEDVVTNPPQPITVFDALDDSNIFYNQRTNVVHPICFLTIKKV